MIAPRRRIARGAGGQPAAEQCGNLMNKAIMKLMVEHNIFSDEFVRVVGSACAKARAAALAVNPSSVGFAELRIS
jgi:hypothetical protein